MVLLLKLTLEKAGSCYNSDSIQGAVSIFHLGHLWRPNPSSTFFSGKRRINLWRRTSCLPYYIHSHPKKAQVGWILQCIFVWLDVFSPPVFHEFCRGSPNSFVWLLLLETSPEKWWWLRHVFFKTSTCLINLETGYPLPIALLLVPYFLCFPGVFVCVVFWRLVCKVP